VIATLEEDFNDRAADVARTTRDEDTHPRTLPQTTGRFSLTALPRLWHGDFWFWLTLRVRSSETQAPRDTPRDPVRAAFLFALLPEVNPVS
jgi:hypothetical protein